MSTKRKLPQKLGQPVVKQSAKIIGKAALDESRTVVSGGGVAIKSNSNGGSKGDISSDESNSEAGSEAEDDEDDGEESAAGGDVMMEDAESTGEALALEDTEEAGGPSFGDLIRANTAGPIDVAGAFETPQDGEPHLTTQIQAPSGASLGTVLSQALRTNDTALLESCLHTTDVNVIRTTVQRLETPLAGTLLHKLAERFHKRPGRAGSMMVWVQATLVTHGGYLATQPALIAKLAMLQKVIDARSRGLQSVLSLKGKLDMLDAQIDLRKRLQTQQKRLDDDDDEGVIYVEGQESEEEGKPQRLTHEPLMDEDSDESEDMPTTNGAILDSEDDEDSSNEGLLDDEAEETDDDSGDEAEVDHEDQESMDEDDESDDGVPLAPPSKIARVGGQFPKRR